MRCSPWCCTASAGRSCSWWGSPPSRQAGRFPGPGSWTGARAGGPRPLTPHCQSCWVTWVIIIVIIIIMVIIIIITLTGSGPGDNGGACLVPTSGEELAHCQRRSGRAAFCCIPDADQPTRCWCLDPGHRPQNPEENNDKAINHLTNVPNNTWADSRLSLGRGEHDLLEQEDSLEEWFDREDFLEPSEGVRDGLGPGLGDVRGWRHSCWTSGG